MTDDDQWAVCAYDGEHNWVRITMDPLPWKEALNLAFDLTLPETAAEDSGFGPLSGASVIPLRDAPAFGGTRYCDGPPKREA